MPRLIIIIKDNTFFVRMMLRHQELLLTWRLICSSGKAEIKCWKKQHQQKTHPNDSQTNDSQTACLVSGNICNFSIIQNEFSTSPYILYIHVRLALSYRDEIVNA